MTSTDPHMWDTASKRMGAASELRASAHLLAAGFDVYRSVSAAAAFDLVAHRDGVLRRVEVKTLSRPRAAAQCPPFGWPVNDEWDLVLIVAPDTVFEFDASTSRVQARDAIRAHYELPALDDSNVERVVAVIESAPANVWSIRDVGLAMEVTRDAAAAAIHAAYNADRIVRVRTGRYRAKARYSAGATG